MHHVFQFRRPFDMHLRLFFKAVLRGRHWRQGLIAALHLGRWRSILRLRDVRLAFRTRTATFRVTAYATPTPATPPAATTGSAFRTIC